MRLKARAELERTALKQMLRTFVEEGLERHEQSGKGPRRRAEDRPRVDGDLPLRAVAERFSEGVQLSNAALFELLDE